MKTKRYDFIIAYEHVTRELSSICILKANLEKNGHSVFVYYIEDKKVLFGKTRYKCDVFVMPYGYDDFRIFIATRQTISFNKLINLQWEQLFTKLEENDPNSYKTPKGLFKEYGIHISWGDKNRKRLLENAKVDNERIRVCGHMALDFLKYPLNRLYRNREDLLQQYGISPDIKKVRLFISSYKSAFVEGRDLELQISRFGSWRKNQHETLLKSFNDVIGWYEEAMKQRPDEVFIYRPHPGELSMWPEGIRNRMNRMLRDNPNFRIIDELSVQQWILVSDWICIGGPSTAIVEAYFAGKSCFILYPYDLPKEIEMELYDNAKYVRNKADFQVSLDDNQEFPLQDSIIKSYYDNSDGFAFEKVLNILEEVRLNSMFSIPQKEIKEAYKKSYNQEWEGHNYIWKLKCIQAMEYFIGQRFKKPEFCRAFYLEYTENSKAAESEILSEQEIDSITERIMGCFENG